MKYESTILKRLIDTYGVVGNPRYISEIIKEFIVRGKERFPELFTYQADWLAHIDEFGLNPTYTVSYTGQSIYAPNTLERPVKSAILKGNTKLVSSNGQEFDSYFTINDKLVKGKGIDDYYGGVIESSSDFATIDLLPLPKPPFIITGNSSWKKIVYYDKDKQFIESRRALDGDIVVDENPSNAKYCRLGYNNTEIDASFKLLKSDGSELDYPNLELISVKMPVLTTTGKNLFDKNQNNLNKGIMPSTWSDMGIDFIFKSGTYYAKDDIGNVKYDEYLIDGSINEELAGSNGITVTDNTLKIRIKLYRTKSDETFEEHYETFRIGTSFEDIVSYEPYKSNILTVNEPIELRGIGDVKDELNVATGELTQRIGEIVLDGSEEWSQYKLYPVEGYTDFITTIPTLNNFYANDTSFISGDFATCSWNYYVSNKESEVVWNHDPNKIGIRVKSEKASTVEEIKAFLSTNNIRINYKLAEPTIKTVDLTILDQNGQSVDHLKSFNGGTHVYTSSLEGSLVPSVDISVVTNLEETLKICSLEGNTM